MSGEMSTKKQVNVDNWGVFFLQRLKHFFNRTDYCDLTLQFQDFAHLKVHRLVLNSCTEYFELLERTCEMYDDCLIMPDDLQADVVVPIVNFMYTGHLEYETSLFDRLYSTAQIMNMTVLTKLLDSQKVTLPSVAKIAKGEIVVMNDHLDAKKPIIRQSTSHDGGPFLSNANKRNIPGRKYGPGPGIKESSSKPMFGMQSAPKAKVSDSSRPTRYEVPEELENDDLFESSFSDISYESRPLMRVPQKKNLTNSRNIYDEASSSRKFEELRRGVSYKRPRSSSDDNPDSKHIDLDQVNEYAYQQKLRTEYIQQDAPSDDDNTEMFDSLHSDFTDKDSTMKDDDNSFFSYNPNKSQTLSVKSLNNKSGSSLNHAKIISEVLKKYPHLVKSNKNIKLKIMTGNNKSQSSNKGPSKSYVIEQPKNFIGNNSKIKHIDSDVGGPDWSYVNKNMNSESLAKLVSLGAENTNGPWLCLICGTPGKALKFHNYSRYYRHLVDVHKEKISTNICEHCGYKSGKRNHLLHHLYTKHNVQPPSTHSFPKCNQCPYIALTEAFLIKHKLSHSANSKFSCNVCNVSFRVRSQLLNHIQVSGHKFSPDRKVSNQCIYCNKIFLRETNLYTHLKLAHKEMARKDGIIDNSDEEDNNFEYEDAYEEIVPSYEYVGGSQEEHVNIKEEYGSNKIEITSNIHIKKPIMRAPPQKLLNTKFIKSTNDQMKKAYGPPFKKARQEPPHIIQSQSTTESEALGTVVSGIKNSLGLVDRIVVLNESEYIIQSDQDHNDSMQHTIDHVQVGLDGSTEEFILSDITEDQYPTQQTVDVAIPQLNRSQLLNTKMNIQKTIQPSNSLVVSQNQPIQIVVSGSQQYKAIVSSGPLIYSKTNDFKPTIATDSPKYIENQTQNINMESNQSDQVMVLQDEYNMACAPETPVCSPNIVVVYSHPIEEGDKQYLQVDNTFEGVGDHQHIESHMEQIHGEVSTTAAELSDQGLVHETVETWQEEPEPIAVQEDDVKKENDVILESNEPIEQPESVVAEESIPVICQKNLHEYIDDGNATINQNNVEILQDTLPIESEINEVVVSSQQIENVHDESSDKVAESFVDSDAPITDNHVEIPLNTVENDVTDSITETNLQDSELNDTEQCMEIDSSQDYQIIGEELIHPEVDTNIVALVGQPKESVEKLTSEWSDDEISTKDNSPSAESQSVISKEQGSLADNTTLVQPMEVEESIENIHEEVQKHVHNNSDKSLDGTEVASIDFQPEDKTIHIESLPDQSSYDELNPLPVEQTSDVNVTDIIIDNIPVEAEGITQEVENIETSEIVEETDVSEEIDDTHENADITQEPEVDNSIEISSSNEVSKNSEAIVRKNNTEKISNLLNDWDDNDSQSEPMEVDGKKQPTLVQKDTNIEKLVSDWDDEDDK